MKIPNATRGSGRMNWTRCSIRPVVTDRGTVLASVTRRDAAYLFAAISYVIGSPPSSAAKMAGDWSSPGLGGTSTSGRRGGEEGGEGEETPGPRFYMTPSRVKVQELSQGQGRSANIGDKLLVDFVLRRSNGYFIYGTVEGVSFQPRDVPTGPIILPMVGDFLQYFFLLLAQFPSVLGSLLKQDSFLEYV
jgi:hypothetical protein